MFRQSNRINQADSLSGWISQLSSRLLASNQRVVVSLQGEQNWCDQNLTHFIRPATSHFILSNRLPELGSLALQKVDSLLGREAKLVIVDCFNGLNPDLICIASGLVKYGGILLLISPPTKFWAQINDQFKYWHDPGNPHQQFTFIDYFFDSISQSNTAGLTITQDAELPAHPDFKFSAVTSIEKGFTHEQEFAVDLCHSWLHDKNRSIAFITADRGRGKSTCLGLFARQYVNKCKIVITAASQLTASILYAEMQKNAIKPYRFEFIAPDELLQSNPPVDLLIIDEAAMLPLAQLQQLIKRYKKIIMATTTGGYEGTGQGFLIKLKEQFNDQYYCDIQLNQPVRWTEKDVLEHFFNQILFLKEESSVDVTRTLDSEQIEIKIQSALEISQDILLVKDIYQLMTTAHYRTRPSDLRMLMENDRQNIITAQESGQLVGVLVLTKEGDLEPNMSESIFLGKRRPRGHLMAQMIAAQAGIRHFACYSGLRIQRIAVAHSFRRQGLGSRLIQAAEDYSRKVKVDYLGSSFAFDAEIADFWQQQKFQAIHIGFGRGKSSGAHSLVVIKGFTKAIENDIKSLRQKLNRYLPIWFTAFLKDMSYLDVIALIEFCQFTARQTKLDREEIFAFTNGHRGFDLAFASLQTYVMKAIAAKRHEKNKVDAESLQWLVEKTIQNKIWRDISRSNLSLGKKQIQQELRKTVALL